MSDLYYVSEIDGQISWSNPPIGWGIPTRVFSDRIEAQEYAKIVKQRKENTSGGGSTTVINISPELVSAFFLWPFHLIGMLFKFLGKIFFVFPVTWKWMFSKKSSLAKRICGVGFYVLLLCGVLFGGQKFYNAKIKIDGYITTKIALLEYAAKEQEPSGKEIGKIRADDVLKMQRVSKTKNVTWLQVYKLKENHPVLTWVIIPDVVQVNKENKYVIFNEKSKTWSNYYSFIDSQNKKILAECQHNFKENIKTIEVKHSTDNVLKESLKSTGFIFPKSGYLELYKAGEKDFYYILKTDKSEFLRNVKIAEKEYASKKRAYFPK